MQSKGFHPKGRSIEIGIFEEEVLEKNCESTKKIEEKKNSQKIVMQNLISLMKSIHRFKIRK